MHSSLAGSKRAGRPTELGQVFSYTLPLENEAYSRHSVEVQPDNGRDSGVKGIERAAVVGVRNPPGLEMRNDLLDHVSNLVYLSIEFFLSVQKIPVLRLPDGRDHPLAYVSFVAHLASLGKPCKN
jgi:hypothetical protein